MQKYAYENATRNLNLLMIQPIEQQYIFTDDLIKDDNLMDYGNTRFLKDNKFKDGWELRKNNNFENLINEKITNQDENHKNIKLLIVRGCHRWAFSRNLTGAIFDRFLAHVCIATCGTLQVHDVGCLMP